MRRVQTRRGGGWRRMASSSPFSVVNIARICCLRHFMPAGKMGRKYFIKILICNCKNILEPDWKYFIITENTLSIKGKYFWSAFTGPTVSLLRRAGPSQTGTQSVSARSDLAGAAGRWQTLHWTGLENISENILLSNTGTDYLSAGHNESNIA